MLSLIDTYDDRIEVDGRIFNVDMRLDTVLRFVYLLSDEDVPDKLKVDLGLDLMIGDKLEDKPIHMRIEVLKTLSEYVQGDERTVVRDRRGNIIPTPYEEPVTDYEQDFDYIYAGFIQVYGIDLFEQRSMDWRKFVALLKSLPKGTKYREIIEIRQMDSTGYKGKDREKIEKAKRQVALKTKKGG